MPAQGAISDKQRWVITIEVEGERNEVEADRLAKALDKLVERFSKQNRDASWTGTTRKKQ
jgi:hypothetical protein